MHSHALIFIQDLTIIMLTAGFTTVLCNQLKQPIVLGYIIAGVIIGPHTPPFSFISNQTIIKTLAEIGVIFLMFSVGLEFSFRKLSTVGVTAIATALLGIAIMIWLGYTIGTLLGWTQIDSVFLGGILSISSSTIIVKTLDELGMKKEYFSQIVFGILIVEDIFAILILAALSSFATSGKLHLSEILYNTYELLFFLVIAFGLGMLLIPRVLSYIEKFKNNEVLLIAVLGICFGYCLLVIKLNYSVALGAFITGAIIAESSQIVRIESLIKPLRDMFSAIFFVSVGLMFDPSVLQDNLFPIAAITAIVIVGRMVSGTLGVFFTGKNAKTSIRVALSLTQIGEFSFIIAALGVALDVMEDFLYSIVVCVSIITTLSSSYFMKYHNISNVLVNIVPCNFLVTVQMYIKWFSQIAPAENQENIKKVIKKLMLHALANFVVVIIIFLCIIYPTSFKLNELLLHLIDGYSQKFVMWFAALMSSMPFVVLTYNKIKTVSGLIAELEVNESVKVQLNRKTRKIMAEMIPALFILLAMLQVSLLSVSILSFTELILFVIYELALLMMFVWPKFLKIHSRVQISLKRAARNTVKKAEMCAVQNQS